MSCVFLHGLGQTASSWTDTICQIKNQSDFILLELSDLLSGCKVNYRNLYKAFSSYLERVSEPFHLCGLSLGGILALQYGIEHPFYVNSLILIGTQYVMPKQLLKLQNWMFQFMPNRMFNKIGFGKKDFIQLSESMMDLDFRSDLKKITCPVLIICGEKDKANRQVSLQLKEYIPQAELVFIKQAGHEVNRENPKRLGEVMDQFYKKYKIE